jgi:hypothetical protein
VILLLLYVLGVSLMISGVVLLILAALGVLDRQFWSRV